MRFKSFDHCVQKIETEDGVVVAPFFGRFAAVDANELAVLGAGGELPVDVVDDKGEDCGEEDIVESLGERERPGGEDHDDGYAQKQNKLKCLAVYYMKLTVFVRDAF